MLARLGGDEFTVLLAGVSNAVDARAVAERLVGAVSRPFELQGRQVVVSVSIGIVMADARYQRAEDMQRYIAVSAPRNTVAAFPETAAMR